MCGAVVAVPDTGTSMSPPVVERSISSVNTPVVVGVNVTVAVTWAPGAMVAPGAGSPLTVKGAAGGLTVLMVRARLPALRKVTEPVTGGPLTTRATQAEARSGWP